MNGIVQISVHTRRVAYELELRHNITVIQGDSGSGKSVLCDLISRKSNRQGSAITLAVTNNYACRHLTNEMCEDGALTRIKNSIVFLDEDCDFIYSNDFAQQILGSSNYFVLITRHIKRLSKLSIHVNALGKLVYLDGVNYLQTEHHLAGDKTYLCGDVFTPDEIVTEDSRKSYESLISVQQDLSFAYANDAFSKAGIAFGESQKVSLKLNTTTGLYTNLGLLLSDQCPHFIKAAVFRDSDGFDFVVKSDFVGSVLMQLESAYNFAISHISQRTSYEGLKMMDDYDYPLIAIREALLNAIMHRDYSSPSPTQFKIFSDRIELVSFGGLLQELSEDSLAEGISACRNPNLAAVLVRLGLVESFGTCIPKIVASYKQTSRQPIFTVKPNLFKITLPKLTDADTSNSSRPNASKTTLFE